MSTSNHPYQSSCTTVHYMSGTMKPIQPTHMMSRMCEVRMWISYLCNELKILLRTRLNKSLQGHWNVVAHVRNSHQTQTTIQYQQAPIPNSILA